MKSLAIVRKMPRWAYAKARYESTADLLTVNSVNPRPRGLTELFEFAIASRLTELTAKTLLPT